MSVSGNDGRHPDVISKVTVEFLTFTNVTVENTVTLRIARVSAMKFLAQYYRALVDLLQTEMDVGDTLTIYSIGENSSDLDISLAIKSPQGQCLHLLFPFLI